VAVRGRWASPGRLLVCRRTDLGRSKTDPWSGRIETPARGWTSRLAADSTREARLSCLLRCGTSDLPASEAAGPWDAREADCQCRLPRGSADAGDRSVADTERIDAGKTGPISLRLRTAMVRVGSRDCRAVKLLSTQIVCSTGESNSSPTRLQAARSSSTLSNSTNGYRAWQQRTGGEKREY